VGAAGVENVISSLSDPSCHSVATLVITSSTAAVFTDAQERGADHTFTGEHGGTLMQKKAWLKQMSLISSETGQ
jgi:hypothetical protein